MSAQAEGSAEEFNNDRHLYGITAPQRRVWLLAESLPRDAYLSRFYADQTVLEDAYGADEIRQLADRDGIGIASPEVRQDAYQADDLIDRHLASAGYRSVADPVPPTIIALFVRDSTLFSLR